jgi:hypothetical protein
MMIRVGDYCACTFCLVLCVLFFLVHLFESFSCARGFFATDSLIDAPSRLPNYVARLCCLTSSTLILVVAQRGQPRRSPSSSFFTSSFLHCVAIYKVPRAVKSGFRLFHWHCLCSTSPRTKPAHTTLAAVGCTPCFGRWVSHGGKERPR